MFVVWQRDWVRDSFMLLQYAPSEHIASVSERIALSSRGERYFYASLPEVNATTEFTELCENHEETSVVLGCYVNGRIYLFNVDNTELDGIVEVTAAHEVLHAAYDRLQRNDRNKVRELLENENKRLSKSAEFRQRMSVYDELSNDELIEELHSVIGTEVAAIDPELEQYYERYFENRQGIVELYQDYQAVFTQLQEQSRSLADSLDTQAVQINQRADAYRQASSRLDADIDEFNRRVANGEFATRAAFESERSLLVSRSAALENERLAINAAIDRYNEDKNRLDELAGHLEDLNNSIDSSLAPAPEIEG